MKPIDFILAPLYLFFIYLFAYWARNKYYKDSPVKKYFIPALTVKIIGALAAGMVYQFYYGGGDTFAYYYHAELIWEAFLESPYLGLKLIFSNPSEFHSDLYPYISKMYHYYDQASFFLIRVAALIGLISFNSYTIIVIFFACISFAGNWLLYIIFFEQFPKLKAQLAISVLFIPSVIFWGSGLFKDTITFAALCFLTYTFYRLFIKHSVSIIQIILLIISIIVLQKIRGFYLYAFIPCAILWLLLSFQKKINSRFLKFLLTPALVLIFGGFGFLFIAELQEEMGRFSLENVEKTIEGFQSWHVVVSQISGGAYYTLGEIKFTPIGLLEKIPSAINVSLFRPYLWEVENLVMFFSSVESAVILLLTIIAIIKVKGRVFQLFGKNPLILFSLLLSLIFAFAVGFTSYNFGALVRYKIPLLPFYISVLILAINHKVILNEKYNTG